MSEPRTLEHLLPLPFLGYLEIPIQVKIFKANQAATLNASIAVVDAGLSVVIISSSSTTPCTIPTTKLGSQYSPTLNSKRRLAFGKPFLRRISCQRSAPRRHLLILSSFIAAPTLSRACLPTQLSLFEPRTHPRHRLGLLYSMLHCPSPLHFASSSSLLSRARSRALSSFPAPNTYHTTIQYQTSLPYPAAIVTYLSRPPDASPFHNAPLQFNSLNAIRSTSLPTFLSICVFTATFIGVPFPFQFAYRCLHVPSSRLPGRFSLLFFLPLSCHRPSSFIHPQPHATTPPASICCRLLPVAFDHSPHATPAHPQAYSRYDIQAASSFLPICVPAPPSPSTYLLLVVPLIRYYLSVYLVPLLLPASSTPSCVSLSFSAAIVRAMLTPMHATSLLHSSSFLSSMITIPGLWA
ncbi:hypothetical protein R3P38DRAFT_3255224 [Favolaschia claudopus]|uniref:Uncharacterized protein n=1 Tax=Favolaschia claudopus TaxID=2862362 RepID=A0AAW0DLN6_9AGAR